MNFVRLPADHSIKLKEIENRDEFRKLAEEVKKQMNMKVVVISIVIGALGTDTKGLV